MKDAYSFHIDQASQEQTYWRMHEAYTAIFSRLGLDFRAVEADAGAIGGTLPRVPCLAESGKTPCLLWQRLRGQRGLHLPCQRLLARPKTARCPRWRNSRRPA